MTKYWPVGTTAMDQILVTATAGFQNGSNTITIPDLTSMSGFLAPAPTGTTVGWVAVVFGGAEDVTNFTLNPPANASGSFVQVSGQITQP